MVYEKSSLGYNEFTSNKRTLNVRERQVLLLVNGERNLDSLEKLFRKEVLIDTIKKLESNGYIQLSTVITASGSANPLGHATKKLPQTAQSFFEISDIEENISPNKILTIKTILNKATDDFLGIMGRGIKAQIEACANETDLRQCISSWHMAMRESKLGREPASYLIAQIHQILDVHQTDTESNAAH